MCNSQIDAAAALVLAIAALTKEGECTNAEPLFYNVATDTKPEGKDLCATCLSTRSREGVRS
jgi:hypothetical protein